MGAFTIPVTFESDSDTKLFVKRLVQLLECPCMRMGLVILVICPPEDVEALHRLAVECKGVVGAPNEGIQE